jgi:hypothetical protein
MKTYENAEPVTLSGVIEGRMFADGAPEAMHAYVVRLADGQRIHTNAMNLSPACLPEAPPVEPDLVPVSFYTERHIEEPVPAPKRKSRPPHNARLPREGF